MKTAVHAIHVAGLGAKQRLRRSGALGRRLRVLSKSGHSFGWEQPRNSLTEVDLVDPVGNTHHVPWTRCDRRRVIGRPL